MEQKLRLKLPPDLREGQRLRLNNRNDGAGTQPIEIAIWFGN